MTMLSERFVTIEEKLHGVLVRHAINALRVTVGAIFLGFGILKFFPGVSPAQGLSIKTIDLLTFGLIPWQIGIVGPRITRPLRPLVAEVLPPADPQPSASAARTASERALSLSPRAAGDRRGAVACAPR